MVKKHTKYAINREKFTFVFFAQIRAVIFCFSVCADKSLKMNEHVWPKKNGISFFAYLP